LLPVRFSIDKMPNRKWPIREQRAGRQQPLAWVKIVIGPGRLVLFFTQQSMGAPHV